MAMLSPTEQRLQDLMGQALTARTGVDAVAVLSALPAAVRETASRLRGLQIADLIHMRGMTSARIAETMGDIITREAVRLAAAQYGPSEYLGVEQAGPRTYRLVRVPVVGSPGTYRKLRDLMALGVRFAPARWEVTDDVDARALWKRIGG